MFSIFAKFCAKTQKHPNDVSHVTCLNVKYRYQRIKMGQKLLEIIAKKHCWSKLNFWN